MPEQQRHVNERRKRIRNEKKNNNVYSSAPFGARQQAQNNKKQPTTEDMTEMKPSNMKIEEAAWLDRPKTKIPMIQNKINNPTIMPVKMRVKKSVQPHLFTSWTTSSTGTSPPTTWLMSSMRLLFNFCSSGVCFWIVRMNTYSKIPQQNNEICALSGG